VQVTDSERASSQLGEQLKLEMTKSHELQIGKERMELLLEFEKKVRNALAQSCETACLSKAIEGTL